MCGIAGIIGWIGTDEQISYISKKMRNSLHHRGPDGDGEWISKEDKVLLFHNRLSVIDLSSAGDQPIQSSCGRYVMTYNGEFYNHLQIRKLLKSIRPSLIWRGSSDTETLIECVCALGIKETIAKLRGMFALALYDKKEKKLYLARDRYGEKPLYYLRSKEGVYSFASEIGAFNDMPDFCPTIDLKAAAFFFKKGYIGAPFSVWKNVKKVMPGTIKTFVLDSDKKFKNLNDKSYWSVKSVALKGQKNLYFGSFENCKKDLEHLLLEIIEGQSLSDVPIGVFLSGGVDSSLIASLMQRTSNRAIKTFSIGFDNKMYNESIHAEAVAHHLRTDHTTMQISSNDVIDLVKEIPKIFSEPFADPSQIPTTLLAMLTRQHVKVALTGDGGDELFSGYSRYSYANGPYSTLIKSPEFLKILGSKFLKSFSPKLMNDLGKLFQINRLGDKLQKIGEVMQAKDMEDYYERLTSYSSTVSLNNSNNIPKYKFHEELGVIENMMLGDQVDYLPNDILAKVDRASMSQSLETRAPLLDHILAEFSWSLPMDWKLDKRGGKKILRQILYDHVPEKLIDRPKQGFSPPINDWLRGPLKDWSVELLSKKYLPDDGLIDGNLVRNFLNDHLKGKGNWDFKLWPVLMWQQWHFRRFN